MADKRYLTDRLLKSLAPADAGKRYEIFDTKIPGFGVRVGDKVDPTRPGKAARVVFILYVRFPGASPSRRTIGIYGAITLERARDIAGEWRSLIEKGIDPAVIDAERRARTEREAALKTERSFVAVAEAFIAEKLPSERSRKETERQLKIFIQVWGKRPIGEITDLDVLDVIKKKKRTAPEQARNLLGTAKRVFNWAIDQRVYGLTASPCDRLKPTAIIGVKPRRRRRLNDDELFAFLRAVRRMPYPNGPAYQLLILNGLRLNEVAEAEWSEFRNDLWVIPATRMKGRESTAREHAVPLSEASLAVLEKLPRFKQSDGRGRYLFSTTHGLKPITVSSVAKSRLDGRMLRTLRAMARRRGEDPAAVTLEPWVNHDLRRNVRSGLTALKVNPEVAEAVLAHAPSGIEGTYNIHDYLEEKREALAAWSHRLREIEQPLFTSNVIRLHAMP
ncbi:MAG TPA: tyrosine-type recombinase/integrase [Bradyrhizobium sp.]|nr:tyrosine-type recombinase/integrase [Bradyrhizobium sp.]